MANHEKSIAFIHPVTCAALASFSCVKKALRTEFALGAVCSITLFDGSSRTFDAAFSRIRDIESI